IIFSRRRRHTRSKRDWSSDVCSSDLWVEHVAEEFAEDMLRASWGINATGLSRMLDESVSDFEQTNDINAFRQILQAQLKLVGSQIGRATCRGRVEAKV